MIKRTEQEREQLADQLCAFLNALVGIDPVAMYALCEARVPCSNLLAGHPTVLCANNPPQLGLLRLLNGFVGVRPDGWGYICAVYDDYETKLLRFERYKNA